MPVLPMFPLGSVLFPHMPLRLRVFEERYLLMLSAMVAERRREFGVVLIERGQEVGGGEQRFGCGTLAEVAELGAEDGMVGLVAQGGQRFRVTRWLDDEPYPQADVELLPDLVWTPDLDGLRKSAEQVVRRTLAQATEFADNLWPADVELSEDPMEATWQLAAISPLGPLDHLRLLQSDSAAVLLERLRDETESTATGFSPPWPDDL